MQKQGPRHNLMERELLDRAAELFARKGFTGTSLQDIAAAAGVGRTTLYHYFRSKDDFLTALVEDVTIQPSRRLRAIRRKGGLTPEQKLREALTMLLEWILERPLRFRVLDRDEHNLPARILGKHTTAKREVLDEVAAIIEAGVARGDFVATDSHIAALSLIGMCNWTAWWFNPDGKMSSSDVGSIVVSLAVSAVKGPGPRDHARDPRMIIQGLRGQIERLERLI